MPEDAISFAIKRLARRGYSCEEIRRSLLRAGYGMQETEETVKRLQEAGYLDDERLAREQCAYHYGRKLRGPLYVRRLLLERGICRDVVDAVLCDYGAEAETETAIKLAERCIHQQRRSPGAVAAKLAREGFSDETIRKVLEFCFPGCDPNISQS